MADESWRYDVIPELLDGKNIFDFIDPDIMKKLEDLEEEEKIRVAAFDEEMANLNEQEEVRSRMF